MSRRLILAGALVLLLGGVGYVLATRSNTPTATIDVSYGDIVKVQAWPVPEGTPPPTIVRFASQAAGDAGMYVVELSRFRPDIPSPLPAPVDCDYSGDGDGLQMTIYLRGGRRLDYFACAFPDELRSLYDHAWNP